jgi:hypothetical protein
VRLGPFGGGMVVVDVVCGAETCARERRGEELIIGQMSDAVGMGMSEEG